MKVNVQRQYDHDFQQAGRRSAAQNRKMIEVVESVESAGTWSYTDVPEEGGVVELCYLDARTTWTIEPDGSTVRSWSRRTDR